MSAAEDPSSSLKRLFAEEASEHLDGIVECLLALEAGKASAEATEALFRHVHSIKGSAGMVGRQEAGAIAGAFENVLQGARDAGSLDASLAEPLLRATDALRHAVAGEAGVAAQAVEMLDSLAQASTQVAVGETGPSHGSQSSPNGADAHDARAQRKPSAPSIRVAAHKVDRVLDAVGETVLQNRRLEHLITQGAEGAGQRLQREVGQSERMLDELREAALELRTVPLGSITGPLPRAVRDIAMAEGKEVDLQISGTETPFDRTLLDGLYDLLGHLLRNAVAHGIEMPEEREQAGKPRRGSLRVHAEPRGGQVVIEVRDDGRGVAPTIVAEAESRGLSLAELLAQPGFSTLAEVSDIAGRGVGLDAVKRQVEAVGGSLVVDTEPGRGTRTALLLPVSLALQQVLIVQRGAQRFGVPLTSVAEALAFDNMMILAGRPSIEVRGECVRLCDLAAVLRMRAEELPETPRALIMEAGSRRLAVACDRVIGEEEVVLKPLDPSLVPGSGFLGATIRDDGSVMLIIDPAELVRLAQRSSTAVLREGASSRRSKEAPKVLVVDDQFTVRELERSILRSAGYRVEVACDGREALDELRAGGDFDMVVTDLHMPEMDGLALLAAIRSDPDRASLPVVMVTSHGSEEDRQRGAEAGADAYIVKNEFDQKALLATVEHLVGAR